jgi:lipopolysaccharide transport system permease protein
MIITQPSLVKKVVFPLEILPVSGVLVSLYHMTVSLILLIIGVAFYGPGLSIQIVWSPLILMPVILFCLGIAWFVSAVGVFLRDMNQVIGFCSMGLLFGSGVFYSTTSIPPQGWAILKYNPVLQAIDLMRDSFVWALPMDYKALAYIWVGGLLSSILGFSVFSKLKSTFADII